MASIDERVVAMSFDNAKFERGVAKTMATLQKLNDSLKKVGTQSGLSDIEKAANKVTLAGPMSALDKLKSKFTFREASQGFSDIENASRKVTFGPLGSAIESIKGRFASLTQGPARALDSLKEKLGFAGAEKGFNNIEDAASRVRLAGPSRAIDDLKGKLAFPEAERGFGNIERASSRVRLDGLVSSITDVKAHFGALTVIASSALATIVSRATSSGVGLAKSLSFGPLTDGLKEYETNLNSIQTILANTKASGAGLPEVNAALKELNAYSDQTIYNFSQMAKNIGTFTAAGVDLDTSTAAIKGIANLAAVSGSNSEQASTAMYQLSQALSSGKVSLQDWNSVVNAGMGGTVFQRALAQTAVKMGALKESAVTLKGPMKNVSVEGQSFRDSIMAKPGEQSWLNKDVLLATLQQFTGDMTDADLAAQGFNASQIKSIQEMARTAKAAATEVKTLSGMMDVVKESIASGWSATFQTIFGDFEEAKKLFTGVTSAITGFVGTNSDARNKVLDDWKKLGGRTVLIKGLKNAFEALSAVATPLKDAFREIFPRKTGEQLFALTKRFAEFTENLKIGPETAEDLKRTFAGFFAILSIGKTVLGDFFGVLMDLLGIAKSSSGGFLNFTGSIGDFLVSIDQALKKGEGLTAFFGKFTDLLVTPVQLLKELTSLLADVFSGSGDPGQISDAFDEITVSLGPMGAVLKVAKSAWDKFISVVQSGQGTLTPVLEAIGGVFSKFGDILETQFASGDFSGLFSVINTTLIGGIFLAVKKALSGGLSVDFGGGMLEKLSESLDVMTKSLTTMQTHVKAKTLLLIAGAITLLAVGIIALSMIDPKRLASAMTAIAVGLGQLVVVMALLGSIARGPGFLALPVIASSMILLAAAVNVLSIAVIALSKLDWEELARGLVGVGGVLAAIAIGMRAMPPSIVLVGPALIPIAIALNLLAVAMKVMSTMSWQDMAKGLLGVSEGLAAIALGTKFMGPGILLIGPGLIAVSVALNLLAIAISAFGSIDPLTLAKGIGSIAVALIAIGIAISAIPPTVALQAAGLIILSGALTGIAIAIALMGGMAVGTIAKGIATIGLSLRVLGVSLYLMAGTLPGSFALMNAATALSVLAPVLLMLGAIPMMILAKGLAAIALTFGVLGAAGLVVGPALTVLGIALLPLGAAMLLAGAGALLLGKGLGALGANGVKGIVALSAALTAAVLLLPNLVITFLKGMLQIAEGIVLLAPKIVGALVKILEMLLDVVIESVPKLADAALTLIAGFLKVIVASAGPIAAAGLSLLLGFFNSISANIGRITALGSEIVVKFLNSLTSQIPQLMTAGTNLLLAFLQGISNSVPRIVTSVVTIITTFMNQLANEMPRLATAGANLVSSFILGIANNIGRLISAGGLLIRKIIQGIGDESGKIVGAATRAMGKFIAACAQAMLDLTNKIANVIVNFLNGMATAIRTHGPRIRQAGRNVASAMIDGLWDGLRELFGRNIVDKIGWLINLIPKKVRQILGIASPSSVFHEIGGHIMQGLSNGLGQNSPAVLRAIESTANNMVSTMDRTLTSVPDILDGLVVTDPVISPILDLTNVEQGAKKITDLTNVTPIVAAASYRQAAVISTDQAVTQEAMAESVSPTLQEIKFEQNNYSPEALSDLEIYRRTNNQLSQAKSMLGVL